MTAETNQNFFRGAAANEEPEEALEGELPAGEHREEARRRRKRGLPTWKSRLTRRILALNALTLVIPILGLLHLEDYRESLLQTEQVSLRVQASAFAVSLGAVAIRGNEVGEQQLLHETTRLLLRQLFSNTETRARVFDARGVLVGDSDLLSGTPGEIDVEILPPLSGEREEGFGRWAGHLYDSAISSLLGRAQLPPYPEGPNLQAEAFDEVIGALEGGRPTRIRRATSGELVVTAAVPVSRYRQIVAALMLTRDGNAITNAVRDRRQDILYVFAIAACVTVLISLYLSRTIGRPLHRLAVAADQIRGGRSGILGRTDIPDLTARNDEIGNLSAALIDMTERLQERMNAIEGFAADVAHELKNPLTSLRSAVETASRLEDQAQQKKLMQIILDDVARLDRLISDISDASRLDAELQRAEMGPVDLTDLLKALIEIHQAAALEGGPNYLLEVDSPRSLVVGGIEGRLGQVFRNLMANATSFSPSGGAIRVTAERETDEFGQLWAVVTVSDEGPGIPENKLDDIFNRFYSERPEGEKFGTHSGLGLSITRQIVDVHGGQIEAHNRYENGKVAGAVFSVRLPME